MSLFLHKKTEVEWPWCRDLEMQGLKQLLRQIFWEGEKEVSGQNMSWDISPQGHKTECEGMRAGPFFQNARI